MFLAEQILSLSYIRHAGTVINGTESFVRKEEGFVTSASVMQYRCRFLQWDT